MDVRCRVCFRGQEKCCISQRRKGLNSIQNDASSVPGCLLAGERIIPSRGRAWRALTFKVFNGLCSSVTSLRLAKEHVSRRAAEEPRCFLLWIQVHLGSQHICKARSAAFRCHTLLTCVLEQHIANFRVRNIRSPLVKTILEASPPHTLPEKSDEGGQKVVSKVKFAPPPFCLFMEMTPWCG